MFRRQPKLIQFFVSITVISSLFAITVYGVYCFQSPIFLAEPSHKSAAGIFQIILGLGAGIIGILSWGYFYKFKEQSLTEGVDIFPLHKPMTARLCIFLIGYCVISIVSLYHYHLAPNILVIAALVVLSLFLLLIILFPTTSTIGQSMEPVILSGDAAISEKITQITRGEYKRGDIINFRITKDMLVFIPPFLVDTKLFQPATLLLHGIFVNKRIVALPGERIEIKGGKIYINGEKLNETWANGFDYEMKKLEDIGFEEHRPYSDRQDPIEVLEDHYFVLADNHLDNSLDSHIFGFVSYSSISDRLLWIIWRNGKFHFSSLK